MTEFSAALIIGSQDGRLSASDRAATSLAVKCFADDFIAVCRKSDGAACRYALGAGAAQVVDSLDQCTARVYLLGRGGAGDSGDLTAARLARSQRAALVLEALALEVLNDGFRVHRQLERGERETLRIAGPLVLLVSDEAPQSLYVSVYRQTAAQIPDSFSSTTSETPLPQWSPARLRTRTADLRAKTSGDAQSRLFAAFGLNESGSQSEASIILADPETCAQHLIRYLAHHRLIEADSPPPVDEPRASQHRTTLTLGTPAPFAPFTSRAPRVVGSDGSERRRRPRPIAARTEAGALGKRSRAPRLVGDLRPPKARGPRPVTIARDSMHGPI